MTLPRKESAREGWLWMFRRKIREWRVLKYSGTKIIKYRLPPKAASGCVCDFVVMLTSHPVHVTHLALVTGSTRLRF